MDRLLNPILVRSPIDADMAKDTHMKFRLGAGLQGLIWEAAKGNGWNASEEIRRRLSASFNAVPRVGDEKTQQLLNAVEGVARNVETPFGAWHENPAAFEAFRVAVNTLLALYKPAGAPVLPSDNEIADLYLGEARSLETAGKMLAMAAATAAGTPLPGGSGRQPAQRYDRS
jgi:hypothetical protein